MLYTSFIIYSGSRDRHEHSLTSNQTVHIMDLTDEELLFYYGQIMVKPTIAPKTSVVRLRRRGAMLVQGCDVYIGRR